MALGYRSVEKLPASTGEVCSSFRLKVRPNEPVQERPVVARSLETFMVDALEPHPDNSDPATLEHALRNRIAREMKPVTAVPRQEFLSDIKTFTENEIQTFGLKPISYMNFLTFDEWLEKTHYPDWRKEELRKHRETISNLLERNEQGELIHFCVKLFMKDEFYVDWKPGRGIFARDDVAKIVFGPWFKAIESEVYKLPQFIKHVPVRDRPRYIYNRLFTPGAVYIATDYSKYENHFTADIMEHVEFVLYNYMLSHASGGLEVLDIMKEVLQGNNKIVNKFMSCNIKARRMSGEMNTSLGNGFSNLIFMRYICYKKSGLTYEEFIKTMNVEGVVEGDDGLFAFVQNPPTTEDFVQYGFDIKLNSFEQISKASFCGNLFDEEEQTIITCPYDVLSTFGWTTNRYARANKNTLRLLLKSKALSLAYQYPGCPIIGHFAQYVLRHLRSYDIKKFISNRKGICLWEREQIEEAIKFKGKARDESLFQEPGIKTRLLFEELYGITVETQRLLERSFDNLGELAPLRIPLVSDYVPASWTEYYNEYTVRVDKDQQVQCRYRLYNT